MHSVPELDWLSPELRFGIPFADTIRIAFVCGRRISNASHHRLVHSVFIDWCILSPNLIGYVPNFGLGFSVVGAGEDTISWWETH